MKLLRAPAQALLFAALASSGLGQAVIIFDGEEPDFTASTVDGSLSVTALTAGSDLGSSLTITAGSNTEYEADGWTSSSTFDLNSALTFRITNNSGAAYDFIALSFRFKVTGNGPKQLDVKIDNNGGGVGVFDQPYATGVAESLGDNFGNFQTFVAIAPTSVSVTAGGYLDIYMLGYDAKGSGKSALRFDDIKVWSNIDVGGPGSAGVTPPVPEPSTFGALAGLGVLFFAVSRRRRG